MMPTPLLIGLGVVGSVAAVNVAWRFASRRASLPCPVWLRWFVELDNPFTSTNRSDVDHAHSGAQAEQMHDDV